MIEKQYRFCYTVGMKHEELSAKLDSLKNLGGHHRFYEILMQMAELHARKNSNYAEDGNPLSNLKECEKFGVPAYIGTMVRMSDKWSRLQQLTKGKTDAVGENIKDTLLDMAVYSILEYILIEEFEKKT